jgi:hypothetical protein
MAAQHTHPWRNWIAHRSSEPRVRGSNPLGCTRLDEGRRSPLRWPFSVSTRSRQLQSGQRVVEIRWSVRRYSTSSSKPRNLAQVVSHSPDPPKRVLPHGSPVRESRRLPSSSFGWHFRAALGFAGSQPAPAAVRLTSGRRIRQSRVHRACRRTSILKAVVFPLASLESVIVEVGSSR